MEKKFTIKCVKCGNENIHVLHWHNSEDEGIKLKCKKCGQEEKI